MIPWKLFIFRSNTWMLIEFPRHCGITPDKLLLDKRRYSSELKLQNDEGIAPVMLLCETENNDRNGGRAGRSP